MRRMRYPRSVNQLTLFHPRPIPLQWANLPPDVRAQTLQLLARFLRQHLHARLPGREVRDE